MAAPRSDEKIDIRGLLCPHTVIATRDALKKMQKGQLLEVLCDYEPAATFTIPGFCAKKGYPVEVVEEKGNLWRLFITRTD